MSSLKFQTNNLTFTPMDDQYYRKPKPKFGGRLKKTLKNKHLLLGFSLALIALGFVAFSPRGIFQRLNLESQKEDLQEKIREASHEQRKLQQQSKALDDDPKAIEKVAREKYGMVREGETVYKVRKEK